MFTGIIEEIGTIRSIGANNLTVEADTVLEGTRVGDSINTNGVCLTVVDKSATGFTAELMPETLSRSALGKLKVRDEVNLERSLALGGRLGGHLVSGHIDCVGKIRRMSEVKGEKRLEIGYPDNFSSLVVEKGSVAIDGVSLTVVCISSQASFEVALTPFTAASTTLGKKRIGDKVNVEFDLIGKYVDAGLNRYRSEKPMMRLLEEGGFL